MWGDVEKSSFWVNEYDLNAGKLSATLCKRGYVYLLRIRYNFESYQACLMPLLHT